LTTGVRTIGGGRRVLARAVASRGQASVFAESVFMSHARSGEKKFRDATSLGGVSTAADTAVSTPFFEVGTVSFVPWHLRLWTSLESSFWVAADFGDLDWPAGVLAFSTDFNS
jgi:hypothetical protein